MPKLRQKFIFNRDTDIPQIPRPVDVLHMLHLSGWVGMYNMCLENCIENNGPSVYIENTALAAAHACHDILAIKPFDQEKAKLVIAKIILDLCPPEAQCLLIGSFVEAKEMVSGKRLPKHGDREELQRLCGCPWCGKRQ